MVIVYGCVHVYNLDDEDVGYSRLMTTRYDMHMKNIVWEWW